MGDDPMIDGKLNKDGHSVFKEEATDHWTLRIASHDLSDATNTVKQSAYTHSAANLLTKAGRKYVHSM